MVAIILIDEVVNHGLLTIAHCFLERPLLLETAHVRVYTSLLTRLVILIIVLRWSKVREIFGARALLVARLSVHFSVASIVIVSARKYV